MSARDVIRFGCLSCLIRGADGQVHQEANPAIKNSAAVENPYGTTRAHPDGAAARERNDTARDCGGDGRFVEHREPRPRGLDYGGRKIWKHSVLGAGMIR